MRPRNRRCPDGTYTDDLETYLAAWDEIILPMNAALPEGWRIDAFDPDVRLSNGRITVNLPLDLVRHFSRGV